MRIIMDAPEDSKEYMTLPKKTWAMLGVGIIMISLPFYAVVYAIILSILKML